MTHDPAVSHVFRDGLLAALPSLRAFSRSLCRDPDRADDLVQETVLKAWRNSTKFALGSNLTSWLFTILRNTYYSEYRRKPAYLSAAGSEFILDRIAVLPGQWSYTLMGSLEDALARLPVEQREAVVLIGAAGLSYEDAARICNCPVGTVKSRVNRARAKLTELLGLGSPDDLSPDPASMAAVMATRCGVLA